MREQLVEIYSDQTNRAIMRHPGRKFPGLLYQGDSLSILSRMADDACNKVGRGYSGYEEINELRNALQSSLSHYIAVLVEHDIEIPFSR